MLDRPDFHWNNLRWDPVSQTKHHSKPIRKEVLHLFIEGIRESDRSTLLVIGHLTVKGSPGQALIYSEFSCTTALTGRNFPLASICTGEVQGFLVCNEYKPSFMMIWGYLPLECWDYDI